VSLLDDKQGIESLKSTTTTAPNWSNCRKTS